MTFEEIFEIIVIINFFNEFYIEFWFLKIIVFIGVRLHFLLFHSRIDW